MKESGVGAGTGTGDTAYSNMESVSPRKQLIGERILANRGWEK